MEIKNIFRTALFSLEAAKTIAELVTAAVQAKKSLYGADLSSGKKAAKMRVYSGLYRYQVWAVLLGNGERWVRMGCLSE